MQPLEAAFNIKKSDSEARSAVSPSKISGILMRPFGCEYAESPRWNPIERFYIRLFGLVDLPTRIRARLVKKTLRNIPWKMMLDFGSGTGAYSFHFSRSQDVRVWGVDIHDLRIDECLAIRQKLERRSLDFVLGSRIFETNQFQPNSMDVVLAIEVLPYLFDIRAGIREIQEVLRPGGFLIGHVPLLGYQRKPETILFDTETLAHFIADAGFELVSLNRTFGKAEDILTGIYAYCGRSRILTAIIFPLLLLASLPFGGPHSNGSYCLVVARKPAGKKGSSSD
jgi:SAM-dependent methyltransferase